MNASSLQCVGTSATLAGSGTYDEQRAEVASVASQLFGSTVRRENVIGETLCRVTPARDFSDSAVVSELKKRVNEEDATPPRDYQGFVSSPLSIWIENTFGITTEAESGRIIRAKPRSILGPDGAAHALSALISTSMERCADVIQEALLAGYECSPNPETGFPPFAFRLHQFISRGGSVFASIEKESDRYVTLFGQQYVPGDRSRVLLPLVFCRECGQEYFCVWETLDSNDSDTPFFTPRELSDAVSDDEHERGFLYLSADHPWPNDPQAFLQRLPDDWVEEVRGVLRLRSGRREYLPQPVRVGKDGQQHADGLECHFLPGHFRFCLHCGVAYGARQTSDFAKLASVSSEGRSTATTILSLSAIRQLRNEKTLAFHARKLLSFTDNRQDASLQAGHFNDFVEVGQLRAALLRAVCDAGDSGLRQIPKASLPVNIPHKSLMMNAKHGKRTFVKPDCP
ncbi:hypothetical protein IH992_10535 [Candidatus Poribacteria bacterium]|nr:hypothetical protein [Candidatus Poribacteria bacterium]